MGFSLISLRNKEARNDSPGFLSVSLLRKETEAEKRLALPFLEPGMIKFYDEAALGL